MKNFFFIFICISANVFSQTALVSSGETWKYLDNGSNQGTAWRNVGFNDAAWASGPSQLGYGEGDEQTVISGLNTVVTTYFRKVINVSQAFNSFTLKVKRDDAIVVYINGVEVFRDNIITNPTYTTLSTTNITEDENAWLTATLASNALIVGSNTIAVEIHQSSLTSSDVTFDLELTGINLVTSGDVWKYLDNGTNQGTAWRNVGFNDATWASGPSQLGYGEGDEQTVIGGLNTVVTSYFRKVINVTQAFSSFTLKVKRDDAIVVYINAVEVFRDNIIANPSYTTFSTTNITENENAWLTATLAANALIVGSNTIAVEIHQTSLTSSDVTFDLELTGNNSTAAITRGPYLQMATSASMQVRWRTDFATDSRVNFGLAADNLNQQVSDNTSTTEHIVNVTGLSPNTKYFYNIGTTTAVLQTSNQHYFYTFPTAGLNTELKTRVWLTGDCGTGLPLQTSVKNAFQNYVGSSTYINLWLLLGDNAYTNGDDLEYQTNFFGQYQNDRIMKQTPLFPTPGNHDYYSSAQNLRTGAYFQNFSLPTNAEAGGLASGTEGYYSFNYNDIHFISLDSYGTFGANNERLSDTTINNPQIVWLKADLAANTQRWTILYWHHPPYTMGSHSSDGGGQDAELVPIREKTIKMLDNYKVDLILCGHSHDYERTRLIKGHYGLEADFNSSTHNKSTSSGKYDGIGDSCPYIKNSTLPNKGIVYVVAGSAGKLEGTQPAYPHNAMYFSNATHGGSMLLEIEGKRLDAKWIAEDGTVKDNFTIMKDVNKKFETTILPNQPSVLLSASWIGNYSWQSLATSARTVTINNPIIGNSYFVIDDKTCLKDTFLIKISTLCQNIYTVSNEIGGNAIIKLEAGQTITANNILQSGTNVKYDAAKSVTLNPGFKANAGSVFSAYIDGCGNFRREAPDAPIELQDVQQKVAILPSSKNFP